MNYFRAKIPGLLGSILLMLFACVLYACSPNKAFGQQLKVATGQTSGTYSTMLRQANDICGSNIALVEQNTSGSMENVNLLTGNQVNAAFVQTDVLHFRARTEDLGTVKTLLTLHQEAVHVLALNVPQKEAGMLSKIGIGDKPSGPLMTVKDLGNRRVGAVGGSYITAQVIRLQAEIPFQVSEYPDNKSLLAALQDGKIDAALLVGGAPLGAVSALKGDGYKLLSFPADTVDKLKSVYVPARLNYQGIKQAGVTTVATNAVFVTREYKTQKMTDALAALRSCLTANIDELKETTGTHPAWQGVDPNNRGKWPYYELPTVTPVATKKK